MGFNFESVEDILVCPASKSPLVYDSERLVCVDPECRKAYDVREDIPILLVDEATELSREDWSAVMQKQGRDPATGQPAGGADSGGTTSEETA